VDLTAFQTALKRYGFDDTDPLTLWINAAMHDFEKEADWPFLETLTTVNIIAGASTIVVPADFSRVIYFKDATNNSPLEYWDIRKFEREIGNHTSAGTPSVFSLVGMETFVLWPVAEAAVSYRLLYQKKLTDLAAGGDIPGVPVRHHYTILLKAAAIGLQAENEEDRAQTALGEYGSALAADLRVYGARQLGEPDQVEDIQGYAG
jgi:hypothetical protein